MSAPSTKTVLADLWQMAGQPADALEAITLTGAEPVLPSSFAVGTAAQATIAASALAANELWRLRAGRRQRVSVDMRHAGVECRSERYLCVDNKRAREHRDKAVGLYRCGDGRWVRLHTNLPHHCAGTLKLLQAEYDRARCSVRSKAGPHASSKMRRPPPGWSSPRPAHSPNGTPIPRAGGGAPAIVLDRADR